MIILIKKINNMKSIILCVLTFVSVNMYAQIPDTIYYQPFTFTNSETLGVSESFVDTASSYYLLFESKTLPNSGIALPTPIDKVMTSGEVVDYAYNLIYRNENLNWLDEARLNQREKGNQLLPAVNKILQELASSNYFQYARTKLGSSYEGVYRVVLTPSRTIEHFLVRPNGTVVQCDETGSVITGGKSGVMQIFTENRFRLNNYFGTNVVFNKELDSNFFFSDVARVRKLNINLSTN